MTTALVAPAPTRLWTPSRVLVTRSAAERPHGRRVVARLEAAGVSDIELLPGDRLPNLRGDGDRAAFMAAKQTMAVVVPPPSKRRLQPIPPSAAGRSPPAPPRAARRGRRSRRPATPTRWPSST
ncbi:hypothetical protein [Modestobacter caceresii]|uniref:hypothetical protein n=1 Tax=Modestobacter caceresii TaxID=1522368 RepID=UPI001E2DE2D2|nr:hypothetical protein [Modestobacter caceresii]